MTSTDIVATKAFGDLVIMLTALTKAPPGQRRLLLGEHLVPLADALGSPVPVKVMAHGESGVPAVYDVRRCGLRAAVSSARRLRRLIHDATPETLLFDRIGLRERWLAGAVPARPLEKASNIYLAYAATLGGAPARLTAPPCPSTYIGIFPGSRLPAKNLPEPVIRQVIAAVERVGLAPRLFLLEGERPDLEATDLAYQIVPRSFVAMIEAVAGCNSVISADSMPAHIAEHRSIPVFVLSPVDNRYWLPYSAFAGEHWSLFADDVAVRVGQFLKARSETNR